MKQVTLLRHAKAIQSEPNQDDRLRSLSARGLATASEIGLDTASAAPDLILCSSAVRTRETITAAMRNWPRSPPVEFADDLYLASAEHLIERLRGLSNDIHSVWLVGHNPDLHELAIRFALKGGTDETREKLSRFPTGARAVFEFDISDWQDVHRARARFVSIDIPA